MITAKIGRYGRYEIKSAAEVEAELGLEKMKQLAGCTTDVCPPARELRDSDAWTDRVPRGEAAGAPLRKFA